MKISTIREKVNKKILAIVFWILIWQIASMIINKEILLVSPFSAIKKLFQLGGQGEFWSSIINSSLRISQGFLLAFLMGILFAMGASYSENIRFLLEPLILTIQSVPVVSFIIIALVWISSKNLSIFISFLMGLPIIYRNILDGIGSIPKDLMEMAKVFEVSKRRQVRYIYLSELSPYIKAATSVALGLCWKSGIAAEVIGMPKNSIGDKLYQAKIYIDTAELFAWTIAIVLLSVAFQKVFLMILDYFINRLELR